jgi:hypothetical protein
MFGGYIIQQTVAIPMGANWVHIPVDFYLYSHEENCIHNITNSCVEGREVKCFNVIA